MKLLIRFLSFITLCCIALPIWAADVTANTVLKRGSVLTPADILVSLNVGESLETVYGVYIGQQLNRTVYTGHKIEARYLGPPVLVKRNAQVKMVYSYGTMQLSAKGRALQAGAKGETISVMNVGSRKKVLAVILDHDLVEVGQ